MVDEWEILEALLMAYEEPDPGDFSDDDLVRFVLGWIDEVEEAEILSALVRSDTLRQRLIEIHPLVNRSTTLPASVLGSDPISKLIRSQVQNALRSFQSPRPRPQRAAGRTLARALGRSIADRPLLPASVRSGTTTRFSLEPNGPSGTIAIEATDADVAHLVLRAKPGTTLGERPLVLMCDDGGSSVAVSEFFPLGNEVRISLEDLGPTVHKLHPSMFRVVRDYEEPRSSGFLRAESFVATRRTFRVRLTTLPSVENGRLILEAVVPEAVVLETVGGFVELRMLVGTTEFLLATGDIPAAEGPVRFEVDSLEIPDGHLASSEILSLRFIAPNPGIR